MATLERCLVTSCNPGTNIDVTDSKGKREKIQRHLAACLTRVNRNKCYRFCFNCSFDDSMSAREMSSLMTQLSYAYSSLKHNTDVQIQYHITSMKLEHDQSSAWKNYDVNSWKICRHNKPFWEVFNPKDIVVLSPDAENELNEVDVSLVYVIGGLVDRNISKYTTSSQAEALNLTTYCLPLKSQGIQLLNPVLNINTVVDILREYIRTSDWHYSFASHLPKRKHGAMGPRGVRKTRFRKKIADLEKLEATVLTDLHELQLNHAGKNVEASVQLKASTQFSLYQLQLYLQHKKKAQATVFNRQHTKTKSCYRDGTILELPPDVPASGNIPVETLTHWFTFLTELRNQRLCQQEKCRQVPESHAWWEDPDDDTAFVLNFFSSDS